MSFFSKHKPDPKSTVEKVATSIQIITARGANKEAVEEAKKTSAQLNNLLNKNGFTINIVLAAHPKS